ncbi:ABC transporter permease subunit, partial [Stenotrophomonas maltophilia]|uniref:ABC transporter permease subunit n=1 Tax=Stenotrophomonas maltophilia TaxID=40324 RepID=UPI0013DA14A7
LYRIMATGFIEIVRSVPLITVLFMSAIMLPLFLPGDVSIDRLFRVFVSYAIFSAAFLAEAIRGGLQAIPQGQHEAADALGLSYWRKMRL